MRDLLAPLVAAAPSAQNLDPLEPGISRGELLRRKYARKLLEVAAAGLRAPSPGQIRLLERAVSPRHLPARLVEVYEQCDGELSSGFFAPHVEFLRCAYVVKWLAALRTAVDSGGLPNPILRMLPILRDAIGNELFVLTFMRDGVADSPVLYLDPEAFQIRQVSAGVEQIFRRLVAMRETNNRLGNNACVGDFRRLGALEIEIAEAIEPTGFTESGSPQWPVFDLASRVGVERLREFVNDP